MFKLEFLCWTLGQFVRFEPSELCKKKEPFLLERLLGNDTVKSRPISVAVYTVYFCLWPIASQKLSSHYRFCLPIEVKRSHECYNVTRLFINF